MLKILNPVKPRVFQSRSNILLHQCLIYVLLHIVYFFTYPIVQEDTQNSQHHPKEIGKCDWILQTDHRNHNDQDPLRCVGNRITQRGHEVQYGESNHVLQPVDDSTQGKPGDEIHLITECLLRIIKRAIIKQLSL